MPANQAAIDLPPLMGVNGLKFGNVKLNRGTLNSLCTLTASRTIGTIALLSFTHTVTLLIAVRLARQRWPLGSVSR
jgi:hypothetical protein